MKDQTRRNSIENFVRKVYKPVWTIEKTEKGGKYMKLRMPLIVIIISVIVILTGCSGGGKGPSKVQPVYFGGSQGLVGVFEDIGAVAKSGVPEVWEDQSFPISILLLNKGEFMVEPGTVNMKIKGIASTDFTGITFDMTNQQRIDKVSEYFPTGGEEQLFFGNAQYKGVVGTFFDANVFVEYTYLYGTNIAVPQVCLKGDIRDKRFCEIDGQKAAFASGGPIQIGAAVERSAGKGRVIVEIPVRNAGVGKAKVDDPGIDFNPIYDEVEIVEVTQGWECEARGNTNVIRIAAAPSKQQTVLRCKFGFDSPIPPKDVFLQQLDVKLKYVYQDAVAQTVRIRENPELK
ncbi:hypothetical protein HYY69_07140 [Candidatus Woesearchaeota archaeon]|nr:hypothetical protein [Candidatus Woesearchaeota archaeon]